MKFFGKFNVPTVAEVVNGLEIESDTGVHAARQHLAEETTAADQARQRLAEARAAIIDLQAAVAAGQARASKLEAALVAERAAALVLPHHPARIGAAERAVDQAIAAAKVRIVAEAGRRRDKLQQVANELRPSLEALRYAEEALDAAVHAVKPGGIVAPLEWPPTLDDEAGQRKAAFFSASARPGAA